MIALGTPPFHYTEESPASPVLAKYSVLAAQVWMVRVITVLGDRLPALVHTQTPPAKERKG